MWGGWLRCAAPRSRRRGQARGCHRETPLPLLISTGVSEKAHPFLRGFALRSSSRNSYPPPELVLRKPDTKLCRRRSGMFMEVIGTSGAACQAGTRVAPLEQVARASALAGFLGDMLRRGDDTVELFELVLLSNLDSSLSSNSRQQYLSQQYPPLLLGDDRARAAPQESGKLGGSTQGGSHY